MRPNRLGSIAATLCLGCAAAASAYQSTTQMNVSLTKEQPQVTVTATALEFPTIAVGGSFFSTSTITVNATINTSYQIALDRGSTTGEHVDERYMGNGSAQVPYALYSDEGHTSLWGDDGVTLPAPSVAGQGTGGDQEFPVFGIVFVPASLPGGTYTDVVTVSVNF